MAAYQNCYAYVHRSEDPRAIYFNAIMLMEMKDAKRDAEDAILELKSKKGKRKLAVVNAERELQEIQDRHVIFLAVKLVHEISHLINHSCNSILVKKKLN